MLRLVIKDITLERDDQSRRILLHIRWHGGACEELAIDIPAVHMFSPEPYSSEMIEKVRSLGQTRSDREVADHLNREGIVSINGRPFTRSIIRWIRISHGIETPDERQADEWTINEVSEKFGVHRNTVARWIRTGLVSSRRRTNVSPHWLLIDSAKADELRELVQKQTAPASAQTGKVATAQEGGAV
jgi:hypothetical protein